MTAKEIAWILACSQSSPFFARRQLVVVQNVSWSMLPWEADLLSCSKTGFVTEIEIKISMADWKADFDKGKWNPENYSRRWMLKGHVKAKQLIKSFYYAAPMKLAERYVELTLPKGAGVIGVTPRQRVHVLLPAEVMPTHRKLTSEEQLKLARLGAIKAWRRYLEDKTPIEIDDEGAIPDVSVTEPNI